MLKSEALLLVFLSHQVPIKYGGCCDWLFDGLSSLSTRAPYGSVDGKDPANQSSSSSREDEYVLQAFTHHILLKSEAQRRTNGPKLCLIAFDLHGPAYKYTWTKKKETKTKKRDLLPVLSHAWWSEQEYWGSTSALHQWAVSVGTFHPGCQCFFIRVTLVTWTFGAFVWTLVFLLLFWIQFLFIYTHRPLDAETSASACILWDGKGRRNPEMPKICLNSFRHETLFFCFLSVKWWNKVVVTLEIFQSFPPHLVTFRPQDW